MKPLDRLKMAGVIAGCVAVLTPTAAFAQQTIVVNIPEIPYTATDDAVLVGLLTTRVDVFRNDAGGAAASNLVLLDGDNPVQKLVVDGKFIVEVVGRDIHVSPTPEYEKKWAEAGEEGLTEAEMTASIRYRAQSPHGATGIATLHIMMAPFVVTDDDNATTDGTTKPVTIDVVGNDFVMPSPTAVACPIGLFEEEPDPATLIPSAFSGMTPDFQPWSTCPGKAEVTTKDGVWKVVDNKVVFNPAAGFSGKATMTYGLFTKMAGDMAFADITVVTPAPSNSGTSTTAPGQTSSPSPSVPGAKPSSDQPGATPSASKSNQTDGTGNPSNPSGPTGNGGSGSSGPSGSSGAGGSGNSDSGSSILPGKLAKTGAYVGSMAALASVAVGAGVVLIVLSRRRRGPVAN